MIVTLGAGASSDAMFSRTKLEVQRHKKRGYY